MSEFLAAEWSHNLTVLSYREIFLSASREISYDYEYSCKPRSFLRSLKAACPIVFSISESISIELNSLSIRCLFPSRNHEDPGRYHRVILTTNS